MTTLTHQLGSGWGVDAGDDDNLFLAFVRSQADMCHTIALASGGRPRPPGR